MKNLTPIFKMQAADGEAPVTGAQKASAAAAEAGIPHESADKQAVADGMKLAAADVAASSVGVTSSLTVLDFVVKLVAAIEVAEADGKLTFSDILALKDVVPTVKPMLDALHSVPDELKDLDADEVEQLIAKAAEAFPGAQNAQVVLKVKAALAFAKAGYDVFLAFKKQ